MEKDEEGQVARCKVGGLCVMGLDRAVVQAVRIKIRHLILFSPVEQLQDYDIA